MVILQEKKINPVKKPTSYRKSDIFYIREDVSTAEFTGKEDFSQGVNYLRLSVTNRCNMRCIYCMPPAKRRFVSAGEFLSFEDIAKIVTLLSKKGIKFVRITGGEPLLRSNIEVLIKMLRRNSALKEINMTTNASLLEKRLPLLIQSGLDRLNISLNTFKKNRYRRLTGKDKLEEVLISMQSVLSIPNVLLKINTVILKGINDDEIEDFVTFALGHKICVRFIEYFPFSSDKLKLQCVPNSFLKRKIEKKFGRLIPDVMRGNGPATNYRISNTGGKIGFISTRTSNACRYCNRLRLTSVGRLYPCLFSQLSIDVKEMLSNGHTTEEMEQEIDGLLSKKSLYTKDKRGRDNIIMSEIGG